MTHKKISSFALALCLAFVACSAFSYGSFMIRRIVVRGAKRVPTKTVVSYLPVRKGSHFHQSDGPEVIRALFKTGQFDDVRLAKQGNTLVVIVKERPMIGRIIIDPNKILSNSLQEKLLAKSGFAVGLPYRPEKLNAVVQGMKQGYKVKGFSKIAIDPEIRYLPNNSVAIHIKVKEGAALKVHSIRFEGNHGFSSYRLRSQMKLTTPGITTWITGSDHFSQYLLDNDLKKLRHFYRNRGYLKSSIRVKHVTTKNSRVDILIAIDEKQRYRVTGYRVSGQTLGHEEQLMSKIDIPLNGYYSEQSITDTKLKLVRYLGELGYAFPTVNAIPTLNTANHTVSFNFRLLPGSRVYVHKISIEGNERTQDTVIRRELRQLESALYSQTAIDRSKQRLRLLGFFKKVSIENKQVPHHPDWVNLVVHVTEMRTGSAQVQAGFNTAYGITYGAHLTEKNFLGSGNGVSVGFENNAVIQNYNIALSQPYYLPNGLSRSVTAFYTRISNKPKYNLDSSYRQDGLGFNISYSYPLTDHTQFTFGYGYENVNINHINLDPKSDHQVVPSVRDYLDLRPGQTDRHYNDFTLNIGLGYTNLDRALFPTSGFSQGASAIVAIPALKSSLPYYILGYSAKWYHPIYKGFIMYLHGKVNYGSGFGRENDLPFFKRFNMGGLSSVPGFQPNSLGPWNTKGNTAIGGNLSVIGSANLILPEFIAPTVRTMFTLTAGNVFVTRKSPDDQVSYIVNRSHFSLNQMRVSAGILLEWFSPMGMIGIGFSKPLNKKRYDQEKEFDFSFGTSL